MLKIKLCGFTREEDIKKAVSLGVDYVGFVLYPKSPRYVKPDKLMNLLELANGLQKVAVLVNPSYEEAKKLIHMGFDLLQLHGEESLEFAKRLGMERVIKAFRSCPGLEIHEEWKKAHAVLIDACSKESYGGSGQRADWEFAKKLTQSGFRVILAGGLKPENVKHAIRTVKPYGVDVSSGIEIGPGIKDHKKMEEFVYAVKDAFND